ncbi:5-(carboxyamino)imidazole ribonucleotide mutase [Candidatus Marinamargulisbacteria bacterium SCGC AAA071-K20]|nr:5-(carboxyamino)imidazole ribonucleotide mutase [Candidatus Marinamargulisbacteria bacterium SCGC AAA071-K20]
MPRVAIIMGSKSDMDIMTKAEDVLKEHNIKVETHVASAHRNPKRVQDLAKRFEEECDIVIAGAGMAAHLPGVIASLVSIPVIGVPIKASMDGLDALLAIVQMPPGIPVATVAINGSRNAGILAVQIIARYNDQVQSSFLKFRRDQQER